MSKERTRIAASVILFVCCGSMAHAEMRVQSRVVIKGSSEFSSAMLRSAAAKAIASHRGLTMMAVEEQADDAFKSCGTDRRCMGEKLQALDASFGLLIVLNCLTEPNVLAIQLLRAGDGSVVGDFSNSLENGALLSTVERETNAILEHAGFPAISRLRMTVEPIGARVIVDGKEIAECRDGASCVVEALPGDHLVGAMLQDRRIEERVHLRALEEQTVHLKLPDRAEETGVLGSVWFWATVAAVVTVGSGVALFIGTRPSGSCVCAASADVECPPGC